MQRARCIGTILNATLRNRDEPLYKRAQLLRLRQSCVDPLMTQQHLRQIPQRGQSMLGHATQFSVRYLDDASVSSFVNYCYEASEALRLPPDF